MSAQAEANVLFDAPGPKARKLYRIMAVVGLLILAGILYLIIRGLANPDNNQLTAAKWTPFFTSSAWVNYLLPGLWSTLKAAGLSVILAVVFGILLGMGRLSELAPVRWACGIFVEFFRAVPVLMMMLFAYYFGLLALGITGPNLSFFGVLVGLTFYNSSVIAELIRSGVGSLPRGQREAGLALGMTPWVTLSTILLPQAITAMLPSIVSQLVVILKDTALGFWISYSELIRSGQNFATTNANTIPVLIVLAAIYIVINYLLTRVARWLERRLQKSRGGKDKKDATVDVGEPVTDPTLQQGMEPGTAAVKETPAAGGRR